MRRRHLSLDPRRHVAGDARNLLGATKERREGTLHSAGHRRRRRRLLELDELKLDKQEESRDYSLFIDKLQTQIDELNAEIVRLRSENE